MPKSFRERSRFTMSGRSSAHGRVISARVHRTTSTTTEAKDGSGEPISRRNAMGTRLNRRWLVVAAALLTVVVGLANPASAAVKPTVTSLSVNTGVPGDTVSITGTNFAGATNVKFGSTPATNFGVNGPGTVATAVVPALAKTGKVSVVTAGGTGLSAEVFTVSGP